MQRIAAVVMDQHAVPLQWLLAGAIASQVLSHLLVRREGWSALESHDSFRIK
jgi:hypothetical protein